MSLIRLLPVLALVCSHVANACGCVELPPLSEHVRQVENVYSVQIVAVDYDESRTDGVLNGSFEVVEVFKGEADADAQIASGAPVLDYETGMEEMTTCDRAIRPGGYYLVTAERDEELWFGACWGTVRPLFHGDLQMLRSVP